MKPRKTIWTEAKVSKNKSAMLLIFQSERNLLHAKAILEVFREKGMEKKDKRSLGSTEDCWVKMDLGL